MNNLIRNAISELDDSLIEECSEQTVNAYFKEKRAKTKRAYVTFASVAASLILCICLSFTLLQPNDMKASAPQVVSPNDALGNNAQKGSDDTEFVSSSPVTGENDNHGAVSPSPLNTFGLNEACKVDGVGYLTISGASFLDSPASDLEQKATYLSLSIQSDLSTDALYNNANNFLLFINGKNVKLNVEKNNLSDTLTLFSSELTDLEQSNLKNLTASNTQNDKCYLTVQLACLPDSIFIIYFA